MQTITPPQVHEPMEVSAPTMASRGARLQAAIIDGLVGVAIYIVAIFANIPEVFIFGLFGFWIYQCYLLATLGQTVGKKLSNIKIVMLKDNSNGGFMPNVAMRLALNSLISFVPFYALVDILFIFREDRRCIHDMIAGTKVVNA